MAYQPVTWNFQNLNKTASHPETDLQHVTDGTHAANTQLPDETTESSDPVDAVFSLVSCKSESKYVELCITLTTPQPKLLVMVLSHLPIKDLSRAIRVSKQWRTATLDSADLRRILFLAPRPAEEYLEWKEGTDQRCYYALRQWQPVILHEPSPSSKLLVEPHPFLADACDPGHKTCLKINLPGDLRLSTVPAAAFLCQPPCETIYIGFGRQCAHGETFRREGGMTFAALLEGMLELDESYEEPENGDDTPYVSEFFSIRVEGVVAIDSEALMVARKAVEAAMELNEDD